MSSAHASTGSASWGHRCHQPPSAAPAPLTGDGLAAAGICPPAPPGAETDPGNFHRLLFVASNPALSLALPAAGVPRKPHRQLSGLCACHASLHQSTNMGAERGCWRREGKKIRSQIVSARAFPGQPHSPWFECRSPWKPKE